MVLETIKKGQQGPIYSELHSCHASDIEIDYYLLSTNLTISGSK